MCAICSTGTSPNEYMVVTSFLWVLYHGVRGEKKSPRGGREGGEDVKFTLEVEAKEISELLLEAEVRQEAIKANKMQAAMMQAVKTLMRDERLSREERSRQSRLQREES